MKRVASLACALTVVLAGRAGAQQADPAPGYSAEGVRSVFAPAPLPAAAPAGAVLPLPAPLPAPAPRQRGHAAARSFLHTLGGAVVGGWLGW